MTTKTFGKSRGILNSAIICFVIISSAFVANAQEEFDGLRGTHKWIRLSDAPNSLYHHLSAQAFDLLEKRDREITQLKSLQDWQGRQEETRKILMDIVGPFPEKTPLNARTTKVLKKDGYTIENVIYESQPGFHVTASLFIPDGLKRKAKAPVVIYCSGHSSSGYKSGQSRFLNLVNKGFVVFAFDPIGQGERIQFLNPEKDGSKFRWPSYEHSYAGAPVFMTGNSLAQYMIWDGIRAVDYLITRKEVDPDRIGITGSSGGGTQSTLIATFDERIKAVAPSNYITNLRMLLGSMGPQCAEQNLFHGIERGIDMADLLAVRAPKPAMLIATTRDMFPIQGSIETAQEVSRLYEAYGKGENFSIVTDDAPHSFTSKNLESMHAFFQKHLNNPGDPGNKDFERLGKDDLQVTETGQLATSVKGETVFSLNLKEAEKLHQSLQMSRKKGLEYIPDMLDKAKRLSGYRNPVGESVFVFAGRIQRDGYTVEKYLIDGEGDYVIPYILMEPEKTSNKALIYLNPEGKAADSQVGGEMEWFVRNGFTVLAPDMIGIGEMGPGEFKGDSYIDSVSYNVWFTSMLIGRSIVGVRAGDVVRLARLLKTNDAIGEIYGVAKREMAPVLLHAAAFDDVIAHVALIAPYASYRSIIMARDYHPEFVHSTVAGSVGVYDLPDLAASLAPGNLMMVGITDGAGEKRDTAIIAEEVEVIKAAYAARNAAGRLFILPETSDEQLDEVYKDWMNSKR